ncbi:hypothetical protein LEP1GSC170_1748 [Leptospira interrogans serovar Bataviae str. HAI135]|nr:hypothetical protein LEP1GSC170_1748 [Leptospira interrogans serovar Bataviae str. HAI135]
MNSISKKFTQVNLRTGIRTTKKRVKSFNIKLIEIVEPIRKNNFSCYRITFQKR